MFCLVEVNIYSQGEVVYVLKRLKIGPEEICSFVIGDACGDVDNPTHEWKVVFPPVPKPPVQPPTPPSVSYHFLNFETL